jgi:hypothetical protein
MKIGRYKIVDVKIENIAHGDYWMNCDFKSGIMVGGIRRQDEFRGRRFKGRTSILHQS